MFYGRERSFFARGWQNLSVDVVHMAGSLAEEPFRLPPLDMCYHELQDGEIDQQFARSSSDGRLSALSYLTFRHGLYFPIIAESIVPPCLATQPCLSYASPVTFLISLLAMDARDSVYLSHFARNHLPSQVAVRFRPSLNHSSLNLCLLFFLMPSISHL